MIEEFRKHYGDLPDAVFRNIYFKYPDYNDSSNSRKVSIELHCKNIAEEYRWEQLKLVFENIISFKLFEDKFTNQIVSETQYEMIDKLFAFDFSCNSAWQNIDELKSNSDFYIICNNFMYKVEKLLS